jgi:hypothetical protein
VPHKEQPEDPDVAAWREIVENYGDRADLPPDVDTLDAEPTAETGASYPVRFGEFDDDVDEAFEPASDPLDEGFVPPEPEPFHLPPARAVAWAGVLGAPVAALLATVVVTATDVPVPAWFGWLLVAAFLGGFAYLVVTMPRDRDDPWDDGARL